LTSIKSKIKVTGNENVQFVSAHIYVKGGPIYVKPRTNWSSAHSTHIFVYISPVKRFVFVIFVGNYSGGPHVAEDNWPSSYLFE